MVRRVGMAGVLLHNRYLPPSLAVHSERFNVLDESKDWSSYDCKRSTKYGTSCGASCSKQSMPEDQGSSTQRARKKRQRRQLENLVTVNRSDCNWTDVWETEQVTTLEDLGLTDMVGASMNAGPETPRADIVLVNLSVSKAGWGFFVNGRVVSSIVRQCNRCFCKYSSAVDNAFEVWLSPTRDEFVHPQQIGEDNDDPTVIYCPPWQEVADLTSVVRDTIRLSQSSKAICSEACERLGAQQWECKEEELLEMRQSPIIEALRRAQIS